MKKIFAVVLAMMLAMTALCGAMAEQADLSGEWYLSAGEMDGTTIDAAMLGLSITFVLNEDGTAQGMGIGENTEEVSEGTWAVTDTGVEITFDGDTAVGAVNEEGLLVLEQEGMKMIFSREAPVALELPAPVEAADIAEFDGEFVASLVCMDGINAPAAMVTEMLGIDDLTVVIENGVVTLFGMEEPMTFVLENGILTYTSDVDEMLNCSVTLLDGGSVMLNFMGIDFYCEIAPEAEEVETIEEVETTAA